MRRLLVGLAALSALVIALLSGQQAAAEKRGGILKLASRLRNLIGNRSNLALLQRAGGFSEIKAYDTTKDVLAAVASGQIKAAVTAGLETKFAARRGELANLRIVDSYQSSSPRRPRIAMAVKKGNSELLDKLNKSLTKLEADGTVKTIFSKYGIDDWAAPPQ